MKKYEVMLVMSNVSLTDVDTIINLVDQGWEHHANDKCHSLVVDLCTFITVELNATPIQGYMNAINAVGGNIKAVSYKEF